MPSDTSPPTSPFADIRRLVADMPGPDAQAVTIIRARDATLTKPPGALGRLERLVEWLGAWQGKGTPTLDRPLVTVFAGSHGVAARGVSAFPDAVNRQMLDTFAAGGAAINQLCAAYGLGFKVFDLALDLPTGDICSGPALDEMGCVATMAFGMEAVSGTDCLAVGEMGIGNTTVAAAIYAALFGGDPAHWVGRGTGIDDAGLARKAEAVRLALKTHAGHLDDPLSVLARLGGREIAAMAGAILAARLQRVPVVLDGYVSTAAAAVLQGIDANAIDHCLAAHVSAEGVHAEVLERLGLEPLLSLEMRLGEASGAALALGLLKGALACHRDMATFAQAGVSGRTPG